MHDWTMISLAALLGLATTSSSFLGAALGLYVPISKRLLACILAFAAGSLISALAIELAFEGALDLHHHGFSAGWAWAFIGGGFAVGATIYYLATLYLEDKGAAVRYPTRFREYALERKQQEARQLIELLSKCDLLRHLPPEEIEGILPYIRKRHIDAGAILFRAGEPGDALYIVANGQVEVLAPTKDQVEARSIARLGEGAAFGEMALISGHARTATVRAVEGTDLIEIAKDDFHKLVARDQQLAAAVHRLSHERAIDNLSAGGPNPATWADVASASLADLSRNETNKMLAEVGKGAGLAIVFGNILDTIPGCLVIGAKFAGFQSLSLTLMLGMFLGGIPEAAASGAMMTRAGYRPNTIFGLWSAVVIVGILAAAAGKAFIGTSDSLTGLFAQALAGGAVLALVSHAMIPEAIHGAGSLTVLPLVAGFLFALYLALWASFA
jgi:CRP-like cAMP-binding protein